MQAQESAKRSLAAPAPARFEAPGMGGAPLMGAKVAAPQARKGARRGRLLLAFFAPLLVALIALLVWLYLAYASH
jgi:hypothetical protein